MRILSLFDGIGCGRLALKRAGIKIDSYNAYEIEKNAIMVATDNFPDIVEHGDVITEDFTKYKGNVDIVIGGSPCKNLSSIGDGTGLNGEQSKLFFDYVRAIKECKPKYFLLENVVMKKEWQDIISFYLGVEPIEINSSLVSAQSRRRLYWTNIENIVQPEDRNIYIEDILDNEYDEKLNVNLSKCVATGLNKIIDKYGYIPKMFNPYNRSVIIGKSPTLSTGSMITSSCATLIFQRNNNGIYIVKDGYMYIFNKKIKTNMEDGKYMLRRLSVKEAKRLQTLPEEFKMQVSDTSSFKLLGNGWTVDVVAHILKFLPNEYKEV